VLFCSCRCGSVRNLGNPTVGSPSEECVSFLCACSKERIRDRLRTGSLPLHRCLLSPESVRCSEASRFVIGAKTDGTLIVGDNRIDTAPWCRGCSNVPPPMEDQRGRVSITMERPDLDELRPDLALAREHLCRRKRQAIPSRGPRHFRPSPGPTRPWPSSARHSPRRAAISWPGGHQSGSLGWLGANTSHTSGDFLKTRKELELRGAATA